MNKNKLKNISKFLSLILRHKPETIGLKLDKNGWADIDELIEKSKDISLTRELIDEVVQKNDKRRFIIDGNRIRANQGHSIEVDLELKPLTPPDILYHGTATRFLDSIMQTGITKQSRQHVHLSQELETAISVGQRHGKVAILEVNAQEMLAKGHTFYRSENGVWLTDIVGVEFLKILTPSSPTFS